MDNLWLILISIGFGAAITLFGVFLGGWLMFRGKSTTPNESFMGKAPKGEVFTVDDIDDAPNFPGAEEPNPNEEQILKKTESFLKSLSGGK